MIILSRCLKLPKFGCFHSQKFVDIQMNFIRTLTLSLFLCPDRICLPESDFDNDLEVMPVLF